VICSIGFPDLEPAVNGTRDFLEVVTVALKEAIFVKHGAQNLVKVPRNLFDVALWVLRQAVDRQAENVA
jgi:hypothetical protein